jgi:uncharacterized protein (TIGR00369 family)
LWAHVRADQSSAVVPYGGFCTSPIAREQTKRHRARGIAGTRDVRMLASMAKARNVYFWDVMEGRRPPPPAPALLGFKLLEIDAERGTIKVEFEAKLEFTNPMGNIQGGFLAAMLDDTMGPALAATLDESEFAPTLELKVNFIRGAKPGKLISHGRVVSRGGTIAFLAGELSTSAGELVATATATARILTPRQGLPGA